MLVHQHLLNPLKKAQQNYIFRRNCTRALFVTFASSFRSQIVSAALKINDPVVIGYTLQ